MYQQNNNQAAFQNILNPVHQTPPPPNVQCANMVASHELMNIHDGIVRRLFQKAQGGHPLRVYMFNVLSQANFNNNEYAAMLDGAIEFYSFVRQTQQNVQDPAGVVANEIVNVEMAAFVQAHPECHGYIDQQASNDLSNYARRFEEIQNTMRNFQQQAQGMNNQWNQPQQQFNNQWNQQPQNNMMGYNPNQMNRGHGHMGGHQHFNMPQNNSPMNRPRPGGMGRPAGNNADMLTAKSGRVQPTNSGNMRPNNGRFSRPMDPTPNHRPNDNGAVFDTSGVNTDKGPRSRYSNQNNNAANNSKGDNDMQVYSDTTKNISTEQRRIDIHDAFDNMSEPLLQEYHRRLPAVPRNLRVVSQGDQYVVLEGNDMNYADHEDDPKMMDLAKTHSVQPKVLEDESKWPLMSRPDVIDVGGDHSEFSKTESDAIIFDGAVKASTIQGSIAQCYINLTDEINQSEEDSDADISRDFFNQQVVEFYPFFTQQIVGATEDDMKLIESLRSTRNARELVSSLRDYASDISAHVWHAVQTRLTDTLNRRLSVYTSGSIQVDSIVDDYTDLMDALANSDNTDESIENFKQRLHLELKRACILRKYQLTADETMDDVQEFYTAGAVVRLPWTSEAIDLKLPADGTPAVITGDLSQDILSACMSLIKRTSHDSKHPASRRFLVTHDGVIVEIFEGEFGEASVSMAFYKGGEL